MKTDKNGCSTCPVGQEHYEAFYSINLGGWRIQYDYRAEDGKLFSCIARTIEDARLKRDNWLRSREERPA